MKSGLMLGVNPNAKREENDFYATNPIALKLFLENYKELNKTIWECSCGQGHLSKELQKQGYDVFSSDLIDRGFGISPVNFLE
jgi:2-polyprenyl-3-methyl-5-hydroxy-6-metoxy-1,4-benzoquinol methylase